MFTRCKHEAHMPNFVSEMVLINLQDVCAPPHNWTCTTNAEANESRIPPTSTNFGFDVLTTNQVSTGSLLQHKNTHLATVQAITLMCLGKDTYHCDTLPLFMLISHLANPRVANQKI